MIRYDKYFWYLTKHKWYVFIECYKIGLFWRGLIHDWHKYLPNEFITYARHFHSGESFNIKRGRDNTGYYKPTNTGDIYFERAWLHHTKFGKHHWQYWVVPEIPKNKVMEIPDIYLKEMICDWKGAGKAQNSNLTTKEWFEKNKNKMLLHPNTIKKIENILNI